MDASSLGELLGEYDDLEKSLADPAVHGDQARARKLGRRYAELTPIVRTLRELETARDDLAAARELAAEDPAFAEEAGTLEERIPVLEDKLTELLLPRDPHDGDDLILEIKSGEGGDESALFAGDLLRMYLRYAEKHGWQAEVLDGTETELGGYKDATVTIRSRTPAVDGVWARQVRGRRAPCPAGAGDGVAGPDPHVGRRRAGVPGRPGRRGGRGDPGEGHSGGRVPVVG
jgi:peptide chain release factor 1